ncbi:MAG TPA: NrfD/PsrC family molybdoenzyme membrane anchor subunit [Nitrososphaerales archaeon]|nr:NrfD/PsrC family molybdoenzyme membrane anchor subunit [Nitrososphaerales archaeon]
MNQVQLPKTKKSHSELGFYIFIAALIAMISTGVVAWSIQLQNGLIMTNMRDVVSWGLYISLFAWFVGVSAGGLIVSSSAAVFKIKQWQPISKLANLLASVAIALAAFAILPDLGRPDRILNLFLYPNLQSPLIWDVTIIFTYLIISLVELGLMITADIAKEKGNESKYNSRERLVRGIAFVALPVAILTHSITAWIFGLQISRPLWNTALLAPIFLASALVSGLGLVILVCVLSNKFGAVKVERETISGLARLLGVIILVDLFLLASEYVTAVWPANPAEVSPLLVEFFGPYWWLAWTQWILAVVALALVAYPKTRGLAGAQLTAAVMVLLEVFFYRLELVIPGFVNPLVQYPPGTSVGTASATYNPLISGYNPGFSFQLSGSYFPSVIEWSIAIGLVAGAALLITLGIRYLPLSSPEKR